MQPYLRHMTTPLPPDTQIPEYGSQVGPWLVRERIGSGGHGVVLRAVKASKPKGKSYALKLALEAEDIRMEREVWLLSRLRHPSVPRLESHGTWTSPQGDAYPYLVMEWVEGLSLYKWAVEYGLTLRQAIGQLAQVARALEATHHHGVHRDVKGGNVRVTPTGRVVLLDFGSCRYPGARPLTRGGMPPGTPQYRSPQLHFLKYALRLGAKEDHEGDPADDVYALGVTAYRLLGGTYPPQGADPDDENDLGDAVKLEAPRGLADWCPELSALILRMLSEDPLARGSAKQVAQELERLLKSANPALDRVWMEGASLPPTDKTRWVLPAWYPERELTRLAAAAGVAIGVGLLVMLVTRDADKPEVAYAEPQSSGAQGNGQPDGGTGSMGDKAMASVAPAEAAPPSGRAVTREVPDEPLPGQKRPPCNNRNAVVINGGCWWEGDGKKGAPPCETGTHEHSGRCYAPLFIGAERVPTSEEP